MKYFPFSSWLQNGGVFVSSAVVENSLFPSATMLKYDKNEQNIEAQD